MAPGASGRRPVPHSGGGPGAARPGGLVPVHGLVHDWSWSAPPRDALPCPVGDLDRCIRGRLSRSRRGAGPARGRGLEPGGGHRHLDADPGGVAVRHPAPPAAARAALAALSDGVRLRDPAAGRPRAGLPRGEPRHLHHRAHRQPGHARPIQPGLLPGVPTAGQLPVRGVDQRGVRSPQQGSGGCHPVTTWLPHHDVAQCPAGVPALRGHGRRGAGSGRHRARIAVGTGRRAGSVVRARRGLPRRLTVVAVLGRGAGRAEPVDRRAGRIPFSCSLH